MADQLVLELSKVLHIGDVPEFDYSVPKDH